jgi:hypothetical protein
MRKKFFLLLLGLSSISLGISFRKVTTFNSEAIERGYGFDTDHDGKENLILSGGIITDSIRTRIWEHLGYDRYSLEDTAVYSQIFGIGYLDNDSLVDMVGLRNGIGQLPTYVYEAPDYHHNPTQIVWADSGLPRQSVSVYIANLDGDTLHEMLMSFFRNRFHTAIYETRGDNQYTLVWQDSIPDSHYFIWGDFDLDGKKDFFTGYPTDNGGCVIGWECVANDSYQMIFVDTMPKNNNYDIFAGNDLDVNGLPEIFFTCINYTPPKIFLYGYETVGDNRFQLFPIDSMSFPLDEFLQSSTCGDIDADGREEIIWANFNQWYIYKAVGVHQYQRIYSSTWTNHGYTTMNIYDLNKNGYPEIIESWEENSIPYTCGTVLWEIEGVRLHYPNGGEVFRPGNPCLIRWEKFEPPGADSFSLFFSADSGRTYDTIATGISGSDTSFQWTVPDTVSDSCRIMIWAYGPPRPGEQIPRGTAWDFSDTLFSIRPVGISERISDDLKNLKLEVTPNPFANKTTLKITGNPSRSGKAIIKIYDITGQVIVSMPIDINGIVSSTIVIWDGKDDAGKRMPAGIYFFSIKSDRSIEVKKVIKLNN